MSRLTISVTGEHGGAVDCLRDGGREEPAEYDADLCEHGCSWLCLLPETNAEETEPSLRSRSWSDEKSFTKGEQATPPRRGEKRC